MLKAVYNKEVKTKNLVTTITGIVALVVAILVSTGVISPEQSTGLQDNATSIVEAVSVIVNAITGIILVFKAKD